MEPTDSETACFEAGIKFGSLYHQFAGTPLSPESAASLERAIEESIENQPHCEAVEVGVDGEALSERVGEAGYTELTGLLMDVELRVVYEDVEVHAAMHESEGYPLMAVESVRER